MNDSQKLDRILWILEDDPNSNREGLVSAVNNNSKDISKLKTKGKVNTAKAGVWGSVLGFIGGLLGGGV